MAGDVGTGNQVGGGDFVIESVGENVRELQPPGQDTNGVLDAAEDDIDGAQGIGQDGNSNGNVTA